MIKHDSLSSHPRFYKEEIVFQAADTKSLIITLFEENKGALNKQMSDNNLEYGLDLTD